MSQSYPSPAQARLEKCARLAVLLELDRAGLLERRSNQEIADVFGHGLHRPTVLRDLRQLALLKRQVGCLRPELNLERQKE